MRGTSSTTDDQASPFCYRGDVGLGERFNCGAHDLNRSHRSEASHARNAARGGRRQL